MKKVLSPKKKEFLLLLMSRQITLIKKLVKLNFLMGQPISVKASMVSKLITKDCLLLAITLTLMSLIFLWCLSRPQKDKLTSVTAFSNQIQGLVSQFGETVKTAVSSAFLAKPWKTWALTLHQRQTTMQFQKMLKKLKPCSWMQDLPK